MRKGLLYSGKRAGLKAYIISLISKYGRQAQLKLLDDYREISKDIIINDN